MFKHKQIQGEIMNFGLKFIIIKPVSREKKHIKKQ